MLKVIRPWTLKEPSAPGAPWGLPDNSPPHGLIVFTRQFCVLLAKAEPISPPGQSSSEESKQKTWFLFETQQLWWKAKGDNFGLHRSLGILSQLRRGVRRQRSRVGKEDGGDCQGHTPCCGSQYHKPSASFRCSSYVRLCEPSLVTPSTQNPHHSG